MVDSFISSFGLEELYNVRLFLNDFPWLSHLAKPGFLRDLQPISLYSIPMDVPKGD